MQSSTTSSSFLFVHGFEEERKSTFEWQQLNKQLGTPFNNNNEEENYVKPFENSKFAWVDSDLDYVNGMVSSTSTKIILHYRVWKSDRNTDTIPRVVLLIHGVGSSTAGWRHSIDSLLQKYEIVVAIDMPGFGFSSRTVGLSHNRWNRAFWCIQLMNQVSRLVSVTDSQVMWTVFSHSMSCLFCPCLIWMVNQNEWTNFEKYLTDTSGTNRFFQVEHLIMAAGTYFKSNLSEILSYSLVQSITRMTLRMIMGKTAMGFMLKSSFNRNPNNEELQSYTIPLSVQNSVDCLVDILISFQADDEQVLLEKHLEILKQLTRWCRVTQIVAKSDAIHSMDEAMQFCTILESQETSKNGRFTFKLFENASHCLMETDIEEFNNFIINELKN